MVTLLDTVKEILHFFFSISFSAQLPSLPISCHPIHHRPGSVLALFHTFVFKTRFCHF